MAKVNLSEDLKAKPRVGRNLYLSEATFLFFYVMGSIIFFGDSFQGTLKVVFIIFSIAVPVWIITKCPINPTRKNWEALCIYVMRDDSVYRSLTLDDFKPIQEENKIEIKRKKKKIR